MTASSFDDAIFIAAPREISAARFKQLIKHYLPKASIILGISKQPYVAGFDGQPQFRMLEQGTVQPIIDAVNERSKINMIEVLEYDQSELPTILSSHNFKRVLLVNGSWKFTFQNHEAFKVLTERKIPFKYVSPFIDEDEARAYEATHRSELQFPEVGSILSETEMLDIANLAAKQSYDYSFQTGVALGKKTSEGYSFLMEAFNKVVPYQTYALHHGNSREKQMSGFQDTAHYDTIHAEMHILIKAPQQGIDLRGTTLFITLLPCPACARTLSQTDISEVVYVNDHSEGYGTKLLQASGKTVRQVAYNRK